MTTLQLPSIEDLANAAAELAHAAHEAGDRAGENAVNKAIYHLQMGLEVVETTGGFLIPSGTRGGVIHRVSTVHGCSCEAGSAGRECWHAQVLAIVEAAQYIAAPISSYETALAEINELF